MKNGKQKNKNLYFSLIIFLFTTYHSLLTTHFLYGAFKDSGWGVRPTSMGGAFCAIADDPNALLWNPAGIVQIAQPEVNFMYAKPYVGLEGVNLGMSYFAGTMRIKVPKSGRKWNIGILWANMTAEQYREDTFLVSFARYLRWMPGTAVGLNIKILSNKYVLDRRTIDDPVFSNGSSQTEYTVDIGVLRRLKGGRLSIGVAIKNLTQPDFGFKEEERLPLEIKLGSCYRLKENIIVAFDITNRAKEINIHGGTEIRIGRHVVIRTGVNLKEFATGVGYFHSVKKIKLKIDYALIYPFFIERSYGTHRISIGFQFY